MADEVTAEYARQIVERVKLYPDDSLPLVMGLLKEFGAREYSRGRKYLVEQITKLV